MTGKIWASLKLCKKMAHWNFWNEKLFWLVGVWVTKAVSCGAREGVINELDNITKKWCHCHQHSSSVSTFYNNQCHHITILVWNSFKIDNAYRYQLWEWQLGISWCQISIPSHKTMIGDDWMSFIHHQSLFIPKILITIGLFKG